MKRLILVILICSSCGSVHQYKKQTRQRERALSAPKNGATKKQGDALNISLLIAGALANHWKHDDN